MRGLDQGGEALRLRPSPCPLDAALGAEFAEFPDGIGQCLHLELRDGDGFGGAAAAGFADGGNFPRGGEQEEDGGSGDWGVGCGCRFDRESPRIRKE